jgi:hypothetical protein
MRSAPLKAEHYREEAARLRQTAKHITDERIREQVLDLAAQYDRLAADLESGLLH